MTTANERVIFNLTPFSVIISKQPFQAMVYPQLSEPVSLGFRSFRKGFRLRVTKDYDPEISKSHVCCRFTNLKTQRALERFIIPEHYRDHPKYTGFNLAIRWEEFLTSFKVKKLFNMDELGYSNADHVYVAVRQYLHDHNVSLKISQNLLDEITKLAESFYDSDFITENEALKRAVDLACRVSGIDS
jgi:hypothetical protein